MSNFGDALRVAAGLVWRHDPELLAIVLLSLEVSLSATIVACLLGAPVGALLAVLRFPGRAAAIVVANALLGLPPVVIGLVVYLLVSRSGPLGSLGILFTPDAMALAQTLLAIPIVVALTHRACEGLWAEFGDALRIDGASRPRAAFTLLVMARVPLATVFLAAFGRSIAEVGAVMIVGGNIRGATRTMTTAIVLETSRGDFSLALALGLLLVGLSLVVSLAGLTLGRLVAHT